MSDAVVPLRAGAEVVVSGPTHPLYGLTGRVVDEDAVRGSVRVQLTNVAPIRARATITMRRAAVTLVAAAVEEGWFVRWSFHHAKSGTWRQYELKESSAIEAAYQEGKTELRLEGGGKLGRDYEIRFNVWPDRPSGELLLGCGVQTSGSSGVARVVCRRMCDAGRVEADSAEAWALEFPGLQPGVVHSFFEMSAPGPARQLTRENAMLSLHEMQNEADRAGAIASGANPGQVLRFGGAHVARTMEASSDLVMWQWHHRTGWRSYCGMEIELIEHRHRGDESYALLNGAKPTEGHASQPLRIEFGKRWSGNSGTVFAGHTQINLCSRNLRGVRRVVVRVCDKDYLLARWIHRFPRVPSRDVYTVYHDYLSGLADAAAGTDPDVPRLVDAAERRLAEIAAVRIDHVVPPQDDVPVDFVCPVSQTIMLDPVYPVANPRVARLERSELLAWLQHAGTHPLTREPLTAADVVTDAEMQAKIAGWMQLFSGSAGENIAGLESDLKAVREELETLKAAGRRHLTAAREEIAALKLELASARAPAAQDGAGATVVFPMPPA